MRDLNSLKNKEINGLSKIIGAKRSYHMTERVDGNCVISDVINYDDNGNVTGTKDNITTVCG